MFFNALNGKRYYTTPAQLNFIKWVVDNNIIDYCEKEKKGIEAHMNSSLLQSKVIKSKTKRKRITLCNMTDETNNIFQINKIVE